MKSKYQLQKQKDEILYHLPLWARKLKDYFSRSQYKYTTKADYQPIKKEKQKDA